MTLPMGAGNAQPAPAALHLGQTARHTTPDT